MRNQNNSVEAIVKKIKKDLISENVYENDSLVTDKNKLSSDDIFIIENEIEKGLVTSRNYSNPTTFLPMNPYTRFLKKLMLSLIRVYTKSQIVFNQNILYSANKLYQYLLHIDDNLKDNDLKNSQRISQLERRVKILEKKLKK